MASLIWLMRTMMRPDGGAGQLALCRLSQGTHGPEVTRRPLTRQELKLTFLRYKDQRKQRSADALEHIYSSK